MRRTISTRTTLAIGALFVALVFPATHLMGYVASSRRWTTNQVTYYVNPQSIWVSPSMAISAVQTGADAWSQQSSANLKFVYGGTTTGSSLTANGKNEVFFRNDANGSAIAEAYYWYDGTGRFYDSDIVFHEGAYHFYAYSGCVDTGVYIEDVSAHEFGHVLGLAHSTILGATMYSNMPSWCDQTQVSLDADDIAGVEALYPPATIPAAPTQLTATANSTNPSSALTLSWRDNAANETGYQIDRSSDGVSFLALVSLPGDSNSFTDSGLAAGTNYFYRVRAVNGSGASAFSNVANAQTSSATGTNTAPVVTIATPYNGSLYPAGSTMSFSATAMDAKDGDISSKLVWTSSIDGQIGAGPSFSKALSPGKHTITAYASDSAGLQGSGQVAVEIAGPVLSVRGYKTKGLQQVDLSWSGFAAATLDVYRNNVRVMTTPNDGAQSEAINAKGAATYAYKACEAGTATCSAAVTVTF